MAERGKCQRYSGKSSVCSTWWNEISFFNLVERGKCQRYGGKSSVYSVWWNEISITNMVKKGVVSYLKSLVSPIQRKVFFLCAWQEFSVIHLMERV